MSDPTAVVNIFIKVEKYDTDALRSGTNAMYFIFVITDVALHCCGVSKLTGADCLWLEKHPNP